MYVQRSRAGPLHLCLSSGLGCSSHDHLLCEIFLLRVPKKIGVRSLRVPLSLTINVSYTKYIA